MTKNDMQIIQTAIGSDTGAILWITKEPLRKFPRPFREMDYLLDGIISQNMKIHKEDPKKNLFCSKQFEYLLFIAHLEKSIENFQEQLKEMVKLIQKINKQSKDIIYIGEELKEIKNLQGIYKNIKFLKL